MARPDIPVTVIGGYLGAGKTTIISRLLGDAIDDEQQLRIAVLVNDFGQVNIDAARIAKRSDDVIELSNGCVCCALADGFVETLDAILEWPEPPDHLVIEPSGVADPMSVAQYAYLPGFALAGVAVAVDMDALTTQLDDKRIGPSIRRQIERADLILATKVDLADELDVARARLGALTTGPIVEVVDGQVDATVLLGLAVQREARPIDAVDTAPVASAVGGHRLESTVVHLAPIAHDSKAELESWVGQAPISVVRAKGSVHDLAGGTFNIDLVGRRVQVTHHASPDPGGSKAEEALAFVVLAEPDNQAVTEWLASRLPQPDEASRPSLGS